MTLVGIVKIVLYGMLIAGIIAYTLFSLYQNNRLLFKCLLVVLIVHVGAGAGLYAASLIFKDVAEEIRVKITAMTTPPPPPVKEKKEEFKPLDLPLGKLDGDRNVKKVPKGQRDAKTAGQKSFGNRRVMTSGMLADGSGVPSDPDEKDILGLGTSLDPKDLHNMATGKGDGWGDPKGEGSGGIPFGFPQGKIDGRVYFMRQKHGTGAWNAYDDGSKRLLGFLNKYFPCEGESRAIAAGEMRDKYMSKGVQPAFLYLYCDHTFTLSATDVAVLKEYLDKGGFLFMDSRPDAEVKTRVQSELDKVMPGARLTVIPRNHPINTALFRLNAPGVGENYIEQKNYGITRGGRLVVFYTPGNFSHIYSVYAPGAAPYWDAQYQMGANVMIYAITKGDLSGINKRAGASAVITKQVLESLGLLDAGKPTKGDGENESVKVKPPTPRDPSQPDGPPEEPDEIHL